MVEERAVTHLQVVTATQEQPTQVVVAEVQEINLTLLLEQVVLVEKVS